MRTTYGSTIYADNVPDVDAVLVERLRAAGAIILGKTNTPEFGAGANTFNDVFGATRNPWDPALTCGGSLGRLGRRTGGRHEPARARAPTSAGRCARRRRSAASSASGRRRAWCRSWPDGLPFDGLAVTGPMAAASPTAR